MMQTDRILLRPWRESDAETLYKYASDRVMEKCGFGPTGENCINETQHQGVVRPIRVLRLEL